jgi:hypothetical protein
MFPLGVLKHSNFPILDLPLASDILDAGRFHHSVSSVLGTPQFIGNRLRLDGNTVLMVAFNTNLSFGNGNFALSFKFELDANTFGYFLSKREGALSFRMSISQTNVHVLLWGTSSGVNFSTPVSLSASTEYHLAVERYGDTITVYLNGLAINTETTNLPNLASGPGDLYIGAYKDSSPPLYMPTGYIRQFQIFRGAVYKGNFTPPT